MNAVADPGTAAESAVLRILADLDGTVERGVVVDSPPGAGKSTLVVRASRHLVARGERTMIVAQTNEQVDDLVDRLAIAQPDVLIGRLHAQGYRLPVRASRHPNVVGAERERDLLDCPVIVATAAKWAWAKDFRRRWAIIDEAYQMRSDALLRAARLFDRGLFVGDPGQLDPFSMVDTERWAGLSWNPLLNAVDVAIAHNPGMPVRHLPISWRLPASAAPLVARAFYPFHPFTSGAGPDERRLSLTVPALSRSPVDDVLEKAASSGWGYLELPHRHTLRTDGELAGALVTVLRRIMERGAAVLDAPARERVPLAADRICVGTAHNDQADAVRALLPAELSRVTVDTANKLQGREFDISLVWHPLSGRADASAFHLETGRLCVLMSRHRQACVVVGRAGIRELLDRHPSITPVYLDVPPKFPDGWRAHQIVLEQLCGVDHRVPLG